ncbi:MAG: ABC transporter permease subunit [Oscillospiraceae bacterium]
MKKAARKKSNFSWRNFLAPLVVLIIIAVTLELVARISGISKFILPAPSLIITSTLQKFSVDILPDFLFTLKIILVGFAVAVPLGMLLAALFSQFNILVKAISPVIIWLVITPMITLIPLLMLWLGMDPNLRVIVVIIQATPIITLNTLNGFTTVEGEKLELARAVGATKLQAFFKITFMNAMPQVFTGIKLGCIFSTIGAISADFVAGSVGMGFRIVQYTKYNLTELTYGCIIIIALIGIVLYNIVGMVERRVVLWKN